MSDTKSVLLLSSEIVAQGWTQGVSARDADGYAVRIDSPKATCFCAAGAIARAAMKLNPDILWPATEISAAFDEFQRFITVAEGRATGFRAWNDRLVREPHHVVDALRRCAESL